MSEYTKEEIQEKRSVIIELQEIQAQVNELGNTAQNLVRQNFKHEQSWCEAYQVFSFGSSLNPYGQSFDKLIERLEKEWRDG